MKATLIITHIHKLYATQRDQDAFLCLENAFVAVHHDRIIDLGTHDYHTWVDKDTRLIDAANEIVVPAFIDPHVRFSFNQKTEIIADQPRDNGTFLQKRNYDHGGRGAAGYRQYSFFRTDPL